MSKSNDPKPAIVVKGITKTFKIPLDKGKSVKTKILGRAGKGYREFTPLNDISFTVYEGDFFGIVGRNGSGKSTLLKTIAGIYEPTAGKVEVDGTLVPFIELGVGFNKNLTGRENVYLNAALLGFSRSEIDDMYDDIVDFAELHDFMEERLQNYSSGMQVRLAFSIAIRAKGDILLLDEVLAVGDSAFQQKCYDYFEQLKQEKKTVILVTHSMSNVERFCNRGLLLNNGEIDTIGSNDEIAARYKEMFKSNSDKGLGSNVSNVVEGKAELRELIIEQDSNKTSKIKQNTPFTIRAIIDLLSDEYMSHNVSISIRNQRDISVGFLTTMSVADNCFDVSPEGVVDVSFIVKDNIYVAGNYYISIVLKSGLKSDNGQTREVIINDKHAINFEITGSHNQNINTITLPNSQIDIENAIFRESVED